MGTVNVTVRFNEKELAKLDELAQRMNKTRSDVIRDLVNRFDEVLREEVEKERKRWVMIGFVSALESAILDSELVLRFIRRNVDVLGYPDFLIGMIRVRNRVVLFSHQDKIGNQLLQLVRNRIEEDVRREEAEIEREEDEGEDVGVGKATQVRIPASRPVRPNTIRVAPVVTNHKLVSSNKSATHIPKPTATTTVSRSVNNGRGGSTRATVAASVPENQKLVVASQPNAGSPANSQTRNPNPQASADGGGRDVPNPAGQGITHGVGGDFITALITNLYHKQRENLLRFIEALGGDPNAVAD